jgi:hypothetical protein
VFSARYEPSLNTNHANFSFTELNTNILKYSKHVHNYDLGHIKISITKLAQSFYNRGYRTNWKKNGLSDNVCLGVLCEDRARRKELAVKFQSSFRGPNWKAGRCEQNQQVAQPNSRIVQRACTE